MTGSKQAKKKKFGQDSDDNESSDSDNGKKPSVSAFRKPLPSIAAISKPGAKKGGFGDSDEEDFKPVAKAKPVVNMKKPSMAFFDDDDD